MNCSACGGNIKVSGKLQKRCISCQFLKLQNNHREDKIFDNILPIKNTECDDTDIEQEVIILDSKFHLWKSVKKILSEREYKIIRLVFSNDLTYNEIALKFNISVNRIRQIEQLGMSKLKKLINMMKIRKENDGV